MAARDLALMLLSMSLWAVALLAFIVGYFQNDTWLFLLGLPAVAGAWFAWPSGHIERRKSPWSI